MANRTAPPGASRRSGGLARAAAAWSSLHHREQAGAWADQTKWLFVGLVCYSFLRGGVRCDSRAVFGLFLLMVFQPLQGY